MLDSLGQAGREAVDNTLPDNLAELGLDVKCLSVRQKTVGMRFWNVEDFPGHRSVWMGKMFQLGQLPPNKFLAVEVGPMGLATVTRIYCFCGTFSVPVPGPGVGVPLVAPLMTDSPSAN